MANPQLSCSGSLSAFMISLSLGGPGRGWESPAPSGQCGAVEKRFGSGLRTLRIQFQLCHSFSAMGSLSGPWLFSCRNEKVERPVWKMLCSGLVKSMWSSQIQGQILFLLLKVDVSEPL